MLRVKHSRVMLSKDGIQLMIVALVHDASTVQVTAHEQARPEAPLIGFKSIGNRMTLAGTYLATRRVCAMWLVDLVAANAASQTYEGRA